MFTDNRSLNFCNNSEAVKSRPNDPQPASQNKVNREITHT